MTLKYTVNAGIQFWPSLHENIGGKTGGGKIIISYPVFPLLNQQALPSRLPNSTGLIFLLFLHPSRSHQHLKLCHGGRSAWKICSKGSLQDFATNGPSSERPSELLETSRIGAEGLSLGRKNNRSDKSDLQHPESELTGTLAEVKQYLVGTLEASVVKLHLAQQSVRAHDDVYIWSNHMHRNMMEHIHPDMGLF